MSRRKEVWLERDLPQSTDPEDKGRGVGIWREGGPRGCSCKCLGRGAGERTLRRLALVLRTWGGGMLPGGSHDPTSFWGGLCLPRAGLSFLHVTQP